MVAQATDVVSVARLKSELGLTEDDDSDLDALLLAHIEDSVSRVSEHILVPLVDTTSTVAVPAPDVDEVVMFDMPGFIRITSYSYLPDSADLADPETTGTWSSTSVTGYPKIKVAAESSYYPTKDMSGINWAGRGGRPRIVQVWPTSLTGSTREWPAMLKDSELTFTVLVGIQDVAPALRSAVVLAARALYDGHESVRLRDAVSALCKPWMQW